MCFLSLHVDSQFFPVAPTVVCECETLVIKLKSDCVCWVAPGASQKSLELDLVGDGDGGLEWHRAPSSFSFESPQRPKVGALQRQREKQV